jgi:glycosyltransferase involved in cell wall biosynthesis
MLTSRSQPGLPDNEEMRGVSIHRTWMPSRDSLGWLAHIAVTIPAHKRLAREADIFHAHTFACGVPAMLSRKGRPCPYVLTLHTSHFLMRANKKAWRPIFREIIGRSDYLLTTSEEIRQVALDLFPHPRSEVMTNAVDTERFAPAGHETSGGCRRLVVPRRLFPKNGVEYFVRAMPSILRDADVQARIVGDGPQRASLQRLAEDLGVADRIEFLGACPNERMPMLLGDAELAVIPSLMEATSIAALEAMSCELPVAASAVGGLPEIIDEQVGALFPPGDPEALAGTVVGLLRRNDLAELGKEGRRRVVANWSLHRLVRRHIDIYRELLDEAKE